MVCIYGVKFWFVANILLTPGNAEVLVKPGWKAYKTIVLGTTPLYPIF